MHGGIPQAAVTIKNADTGAQRRLTTDASGRYAAPSIAVGVYEITVAKEGFAAQSRSSIQLVVGQSATVDFDLAVGAIQQTVTVEEAPEPVNLSTPADFGIGR